MSFNRIIGRNDPIRNYSGEYPYIIAQNAKIAQMDSLIQRNTARLYPSIADPFGSNPLGQFGTDLTTPVDPAATTDTAGTVDGTAGTGMAIDGATGSAGADGGMAVDGTDGTAGVDGTAGAAGPGETTGAGSATHPKSGGATYDNVDLPFAPSFVNIPYWSWKLNGDQQVALDMLQHRGDDLIAEYVQANKGAYPPEASKFTLPTSVPKFTKYEMSDRQMMYLCLYRPPDKIKIAEPRVQTYALEWCKAMTVLMNALGSQFTLSPADLIAYCKPDAQTMPVPPKVSSAKIVENKQSKDGYITYYNIRKVKEGGMSIAQAQATFPGNSPNAPDTYVSGTVNTLSVK